MKSQPRLFVAFFLFPLMFLLAMPGSVALADEEEDLWAPAPPRLSHIDGQVSYLREGADDWVRARPNLALAEGDALYTGPRANIEVQFDDRGFARADENSQLTLVDRESNYIQFRVASGLVSFDIRTMKVGDTVEVSTPHAVFIIERAGYYRVEVNARTHFITRHGGSATVTTSDGRGMSIYPSEDIVLTPGNPVQVATYVAPAPDKWDRWNDERSDRSGDSVSARYLPPGIYGAEELDHHGDWRVVPDYGPVWIPRGVGREWVPYSTGSWVWDPYYEWTWIDDAPWGWAPFHYGRWVSVEGYWAWAPGPVVRRPLYAPALVAFMVRGHDVSLRVSIGLPGLWWVALGWGEPVLPWWGRHEHRGHPRWAGWGGPRMGFDPGKHRYRNSDLPRAILTVPPEKFGREPFRATIETRFNHEQFRTVRGDLPVKPSRHNLVGGAPKGVEPPRDIFTRPVVSTRMPREKILPWHEGAPRVRGPAIPEPRLVNPPARVDEVARAPSHPAPRPPFGQLSGPNAGPERSPPPLPPRLGEVRVPVPMAPPPAMAPGGKPRQPSLGTPPGVRPGPSVPPPREGMQTQPDRKRAPPQGDIRDGRKTLPGLPANKMYMKGQDRDNRQQKDQGRHQ